MAVSIRSLADPDYIPPARKASKAEVAKWFNVSIGRVEAWMRAECPSVSGGGQGVPWVFDLKDVAEWYFTERKSRERSPGSELRKQVHPADPDFDPDHLLPAERRAWYAAEAAKRTLQERDRELIPASEHAAGLAEVIKMTVTVMDALPDLLERDADAPPKVVASARDITDQLRASLYLRLSGDV